MHAADGKSTAAIIQANREENKSPVRSRVNDIHLESALKLITAHKISLEIEKKGSREELHIPNSQFEVYTDGSRINDNTALSVCIFPTDETPNIYRFKLNKNNTVFQAELAAIDFGVRWVLENHKSINIHTESRSSIEALRSTRPRSALVIRVKENFYMAVIWWGSTGSKRMSATQVTSSRIAMQN
ncbi:hypothetical protein AVEN_223170-1 [Araneus ventricosus]|uniref:RNase H type-1 domain-containing protein n=1 Tax=Araneus ventricosus TaxID=182803 RepID=A0A4Y2FTY4_ARAVE|nr:hypothetical protein AVEN_223170-1 [Araneus ventricosus]